MNDTTEGIMAMKDVIHFLVPGVNFDNGGINSDDIVQYLSVHNITNIVYNPKNTDTKNCASLRALKANTSTSMSVLNVILSLDERIKHIKMMIKYTDPTGLFIFKIYEGDRSCILSHIGTQYAQLNMPIESYATILHREFKHVLMYKSRSMYVCCNK
jgi:hypothetical protein